MTFCFSPRKTHYKHADFNNPYKEIEIFFIIFHFVLVFEFMFLFYIIIVLLQRSEKYVCPLIKSNEFLLRRK